MPVPPEQQARTNIDRMLNDAGWVVQDYKAFDPSASTGIALRQVPLKSGRCDYRPLVGASSSGDWRSGRWRRRRSFVACRRRRCARVAR